MIRVIGLVILGLIVIGLFNSDPARTPPQRSTFAEAGTAVETTPAMIPPPAVGAELSQEYFKQVESEADYPCKKAIEDSAKYGVRWTSWLSRFNRINKYQRADGYVRLSGDEAEAQNGLGNWLRANYSCTFDPASKRVINVHLEGGKLPRLP